MKYIDYYPPVLKEIREINIIADNIDTGLEYIRNGISDVCNECFVFNAVGVGLEKLEKIFNINVIDADIELRRFNILAKMMNSKGYLIDILNSLLGENGYTLRYFTSEQRLEVVLALERKEYLEIIKNLLENFVPVNIELDISLAYNTHNVIGKHKNNELTEYTHNNLVVKEGL